MATHVKRFQTRISLKTDQGINWEANHDIVLLRGEFAWTDISRPDGSQVRDFKIGDGTSAWKALPYILPVGDGATIISGTATPDHAHVLSVGLIGSNKVNALTGYDSTGVSYTALSTSDSLNTALAKLEAGIASAQTAGVTSFGSATGAITVGNGLQMDNSQVSARTTGYIVNNAGSSSNAIDIDSNKIDSGYSTSNTTNLATVATVTAALGTLDVSEFGLGSLENVIISSTGYDTLKIADIKEVDGKISQGTGGNALSIDIDKDHPYVAGTTSENTYTQGNPLATVATVTAAVNGALDAEVTFRGVTSSLPSTPANGDMWKASGAITVTAASDAEGVGFTTKAGDTIIYRSGTGGGWYLIPSADDVEDTWRQILVNSSSFLGSGTSSGSLKFADGTCVSLGTATDTDGASHTTGTITVNHAVPTNYTSTDSTTNKSQGDQITVANLTRDSLGHVLTLDKYTFTIPQVYDAVLEIIGSNGGPITVTAADNHEFSANASTKASYTVTHAAAPTTGTPEARKVYVDAWGHVKPGDTLVSSDILTVAGDPGHNSSTTTTVSTALQSLATSISSNSAGTLDTTTAAVNNLSANSSESLHGTVQLHKVSKTGNIAHLGQQAATVSNGLTDTPDMIIFDCGSATVNTLT